MEQEGKNLLLKDLCARLPYGVIADNPNPAGSVWDELISIDIPTGTVTLLYDGRTYKVEKIKPYLRPMSSITQEEIDEYDAELDKDMDIVMNGALDKDRYITSDEKHNFSKNFVAHFGNDWLNAHHFDYRGLIPMGLALVAPEGMYKSEQK